MINIKDETEVKEMVSTITSYVNTVLLARTYFEVMNEAVQKVHSEILEQMEIYSDDIPSRGRKKERILNSGNLYLSKDEALCKKFYLKADAILKEKKIKPQDMDALQCPALTANSTLRDAQHLLIEAAAPFFNITLDKLLCSKNGLEKHRKYLDLLCGLVTNFPGWKSPLQKRKDK